MIRKFFFHRHANLETVGLVCVCVGLKSQGLRTLTLRFLTSEEAKRRGGEHATRRGRGGEGEEAVMRGNGLPNSLLFSKTLS